MGPLKTRRFGRNWKNATSYERGLVVVIVATLLLYAYVLTEFPSFISDVVIYSVGSTLLTVEGFFLALTSRIPLPERKLATLAGLAAVVLSVLTISKAFFESVQLRYLSFAPTTAIFDSDVALFALFLGIYAVNMVWPQTRRDPVGQEDQRLLY